MADFEQAFTHMAVSLRKTKESLDLQMVQERSMNDALQSLQRQLVRQERLAAVGVLASGIAHELNNPLQAIVGATELLERNPSLDEDARGEVDFVKVQSDRAVTIIRSLARFGSRDHSIEPQVVDLCEIINEVIKLQPTVDDDAVSLTLPPQGVRPVHANVAELEQVVLNFVINARQAVAIMPAADRRISLKVTDVGRWVRFEVSDNGPGVAPDDEAKLFQPFFTTKSVGHNTGLGLSVSYGIVQSLGGTIGYFRNDWGGATFFFELPCAEENPAPHDTSALLRRLV